MKFGTIPTADALGAILAHSVQLSQGRMRKGKVLTAQDISQLSADGVAAVTVAQLGPDDVHEDVAAQRLAHAFVDAAHGLRLSEATTGRVNVIATQPGVFCGDVAAINAVNAVDPAITIATLSQYKRVAAGDMVATIKIISYGVAQQDLQKACNAAQPLALRPAIHGAVTLIETQIGKATPSPKGRNARQPHPICTMWHPMPCDRQGGQSHASGCRLIPATCCSQAILDQNPSSACRAAHDHWH